MLSTDYVKGWGLQLVGAVQNLGGKREEDSKAIHRCVKENCSFYSHASPTHVYRWFPRAGSNLIFLEKEEKIRSTDEWYLLEYPGQKPIFLKNIQRQHKYALLTVVPREKVPTDLLGMTQLSKPEDT